MRNCLKIALAATALLAASAGSATVVNFDGVPNGTVANPYSQAGATFSSAGFNYVQFGTLCSSASASNSANCPYPLQVDFDGFASGISFTFWANNTLTIGADIGDVQIFRGATLLGTVDISVKDGSPYLDSRDLVSLTGYTDVTRMILSTTDFGGIGYDDFTFTLSETPSAPEPATWAMMLFGFGLIGSTVRRRNAGKTAIRFA